MFKHDFSSYFQKTNNKLYILALAFGFLLFLSGCKSAELKALEDSASVIQLTTGQEVRRWTQDKDWGFSGPIYPEIMILYESISNHTRKEVYDEIVAILEKNNWESEPVTVPDYFKATLQQSQFEISGSVTIDPDRNLVIVVMTIY